MLIKRIDSLAIEIHLNDSLAIIWMILVYFSWNFKHKIQQSYDIFYVLMYQTCWKFRFCLNRIEFQTYKLKLWMVQFIQRALTIQSDLYWIYNCNHWIIIKLKPCNFWIQRHWKSAPIDCFILGFLIIKNPEQSCYNVEVHLRLLYFRVIVFLIR